MEEKKTRNFKLIEINIFSFLNMPYTLLISNIEMCLRVCIVFIFTFKCVSVIAYYIYVYSLLKCTFLHMRGYKHLSY